MSDPKLPTQEEIDASSHAGITTPGDYLPQLPSPTPWALGLAAQAWCEPETSSIVMNEKLAFAFARILDDVVNEHESK